MKLISRLRAMNGLHPINAKVMRPAPKGAETIWHSKKEGEYNSITRQLTLKEREARLHIQETTI